MPSTFACTGLLSLSDSDRMLGPYMIELFVRTVPRPLRTPLTASAFLDSYRDALLIFISAFVVSVASLFRAFVRVRFTCPLQRSEAPCPA